MTSIVVFVSIRSHLVSLFDIALAHTESNYLKKYTNRWRFWRMKFTLFLKSL